MCSKIYESSLKTPHWFNGVCCATFNVKKKQMKTEIKGAKTFQQNQ